MIRNATLLSLALLLFCAGYASADFYDDCVSDCSKARTECIEGITLYDETGIKEAKEACEAEFRSCKAKCHEDDAKSNEAADRERRAKEAEEAERKRLEQQDTLNGSIRVLSFE